MEYTNCQMMKELSYGSEYNKKRRPVYRVRFPWHELAKNMYISTYTLLLCSIDSFIDIWLTQNFTCLN